MSEKLKKIGVILFEKDLEYLDQQGYAASTLIRKIVRDYVSYHKVKIDNPIKEIKEDKE